MILREARYATVAAMAWIFALVAPAAAQAPANPGQPLPWGIDSAFAANHAIDGLQAYLVRQIDGPRGVHIETLMTAVGALAGFSAQHAIRETVVKSGKLPEHGGKDAKAGAFIVATTKSGETFYFGDLLNSYLVLHDTTYGPGRFTLFAFTAKAVEDAKRQPLGQPEIAAIFKHAGATAGAPEFGIPRLPERHKPKLLPREALNRFWPATMQILSRTSAAGSKGESLSPQHWPAVIGIVAQRFIEQSKDVLDPAMSMRIIFEAAIPMSKVDPRTVK